ncbi:PREDICTED: uncharacterized protein LOC104808506 isoform X2 [Tarenaya hassleriana]|uniref:uncharacterized protein LOC104808506 isoform X2 n=1 Tax=Tarenaya hassleriana TaxID=28532 RepID=UPI00053C1CFC|nr:PREDICTED: uncharacterized protein LOC104808506 isoform X2 [Tarenaya hassleriana]
MVKRRNPRAEEEEEETENQPLITAKVVEYLEPVMSRDLLCKFPDNSALGFDYSQSSLWSPLLPRNYGRDLDLHSDSRRDLSLELGEEKKTEMKLTKNRFLGFDVSAIKMKRKKTRKSKVDSGFSADSRKFGCFVISTKLRGISRRRRWRRRRRRGNQSVM